MWGVRLLHVLCNCWCDRTVLHLVAGHLTSIHGHRTLHFIIQHTQSFMSSGVLVQIGVREKVRMTALFNRIYTYIIFWNLNMSKIESWIFIHLVWTLYSEWKWHILCWFKTFRARIYQIWIKVLSSNAQVPFILTENRSNFLQPHCGATKRQRKHKSCKFQNKHSSVVTVI